MKKEHWGSWIFFKERLKKQTNKNYKNSIKEKNNIKHKEEVLEIIKIVYKL